jgi:hypothetical protein
MISTWPFYKPITRFLLFLSKHVFKEVNSCDQLAHGRTFVKVKIVIVSLSETRNNPCLKNEFGFLNIKCLYKSMLVFLLTIDLSNPGHHEDISNSS